MNAKTLGNLSAFPTPSNCEGTGMNCRDWLIGQALAGLAAGYFSQGARDANITPADIGEIAVKTANATLAAMAAAEE